MPQHFFRRSDSPWQSFWHEPRGEFAPVWPYFAIGAALALMIIGGFLLD